MVDMTPDTVVAITGASSGIGEATARHLARRGARIVIGARRTDRLDAIADELRSDGAEVVTAALDVTRRPDLDRLVQTAVDRFGGLDVLVWNGGGPPPGTAREADDSSLESAYRLLLRPAVTLVRLCLPHLERSPAGRIVALTSLAA